MRNLTIWFDQIIRSLAEDSTIQVWRRRMDIDKIDTDKIAKYKSTERQRRR